MEIATLIVICLVTVCFILTVVFLLSYLIRRNKSKLKNAGIAFSATVIGLSTLLVLEEQLFSYNTANKKEILVASRESSIGGVLLKLYADSTFEIGGLRQVTSAGMFSLKKDTLFMTTIITEENEEFSMRSFLIKEDHLEETTDTGIEFLEIHENSLK
ncbi:hypothetical protein ACD591_14360 [Rufibacter glacialis]|uniref:Uncharacterized protein n=1 Tax=Rufibacter glacialis TaxID=1259555 RepID=A0A5M8Q529_9BACT|nr:hypothetical protein [Rufibacter glacialis]KAA6430975.1 hypothetical protein FOE74_17870 [Rufibacter glacialis]GGK82966.1 hypothetical protein GCM10011405_33510 [Rufibacter glacialis]